MENLEEDNEKKIETNDDEANDEEYDEDDEDYDDEYFEEMEEAPEIKNDFKENNLSENEFLSSENDSDEEEEEEDNTTEILLDLIMAAHKRKNVKNPEKNTFLKSIKTFVKAGMEKKTRTFNADILEKCKYLSNNIITGDIPLSISNTEKFLLNKIKKGKYKDADMKILLVEDFTVQAIFERAIKLFEKELKKNVQ